MNRDTDLVQFRLGIGGQIEYRQRMAHRSSDETRIVVDNAWGPWEQIQAIKGDESDRQFE